MTPRDGMAISPCVALQILLFAFINLVLDAHPRSCSVSSTMPSLSTDVTYATVVLTPNVCAPCLSSVGCGSRRPHLKSIDTSIDRSLGGRGSNFFLGGTAGDSPGRPPALGNVYTRLPVPLRHVYCARRLVSKATGLNRHITVKKHGIDLGQEGFVLYNLFNCF